MKSGFSFRRTEPAAVLEQFHDNIVKRNDRRAVFRFPAEGNGHASYLKYTFARTFGERIQNLLFPRARSEFHSARLLEKCGIPCVRCESWNYDFSGCSITSEALPETFLPFAEFWYGFSSPESRKTALKNVCLLLRALVENRLFHPDLHAGNIMIDRENFSLALVDPFGVRRTLFRPDPEHMLSCPLMMRPQFDPGELAEALSQAGLFGGNYGQALFALRRAARKAEESLAAEWPRRRRQILGGTSKFAVFDGTSKWVRNSAWFAPRTPPESGLVRQEYGAEEGENLWVDSFRRQLLREPLGKVPVFFEKAVGKSFLTWLEDENIFFFYGF